MDSKGGNELVVRVHIGKPLARWLLVLAMVACSAVELESETLTMTSYYPSPAGVYNKLVTTGNTVLARDRGRVGIGTSAPQGLLDIAGTTGGLVLPRLTMAETNAITAVGSVVFDTDMQTVEVRTQEGWRPLTSVLAEVPYATLHGLDWHCSSYMPENCSEACAKYCTSTSLGRAFRSGAAMDTSVHHTWWIWRWHSSGADAQCLCVP
ncbi:MAG: hypothetical protein WC943_13100 [Elusimicrobiota bacterium]|jgi:hypothetical protein